MKNGMTGKMAPIVNTENEAAAAVHAEPPKFPWIDANLLPVWHAHPQLSPLPSGVNVSDAGSNRTGVRFTSYAGPVT